MLRAVVNYVQGSVAELRKVTWPTRAEILRFTLIILVSIIVSMLIVALVDYGLSFLVNTYLIQS